MNEKELLIIFDSILGWLDDLRVMLLDVIAQIPDDETVCLEEGSSDDQT